MTDSKEELRLTRDRVAFMRAKLKEYKELEPDMNIDGVLETLEGDCESQHEMSLEDTHGQGHEIAYSNRPDYWISKDGEPRLG